MSRGFGGVIAGVVLAFACAGNAAADTWCVPSGGPGCDHVSADLQTALDQAATHAGNDTVSVRPGTFAPNDCTTAGFSYTGSAGNALTLIGAGSTQTWLTCQDNYNNASGSTPILTLSGPATISGVQIQMPTGMNDVGLSLSGGASADNVDVLSVQTAGANAVALRMTGGSFTSGLIGIPLSEPGVAVDATAGATLDTVSLVSGGDGLRTSGNADVTLTRAEITAPRGVVDDGGNVHLADVAIDPQPGSNPTRPGGLIIDTPSATGAVSITARNVSIGGRLANSYGVYAAASSVDETASVTLTDSAIHGPTTALFRSAVTGATANLTTSYDAYPAGNYAGTGNGATTVLTPPVTADPGFFGSGNFRVDAGSPLIDAGSPGPLAPGEPATDPDGNPRILDGNHDCVARRDIGAYEFNDPTPTAKVTASASRVLTGARVTFHGVGCSNNPLVPVTLGWSFDDGATATGIDVTHVFTRAGTHRATLTVRDGSGNSATGTASVTVISPMPTPTLSKLKLRPARFHVKQRRHTHFKLGTTLSYSDSLAAATTFTVTQRARGVRKGKRCVAPPRRPAKRGKKPRRCTRTVTLGSFTHRDKAGANSMKWSGKLKRRAVKPGSYTLQATATLARRKSRTVSTRFTVLA